MCTLPSLSQVSASLLEAAGGDNLHAAMLFHHAGKDTSCRVASREYKALLSRFFLGKYKQVCAAIRPPGSLNDAVSFRQYSTGMH